VLGVSTLDLSGNRFSDTLHDFSRFKFVSDNLLLASNQFVGTPDFTTMPLNFVRVLNLSHNLLSGTPNFQSICQYAEIKCKGHTLDLSHNMFLGRPNFTNISCKVSNTLRMSYNAFVDYSLNLAEMTSGCPAGLQELDFSHNQFRGVLVLPGGWARYSPAGFRIDVSDNQLQGQPDLTNPPWELTYLNLSHNQFNSTLDLQYFVGPNTLDFSWNNFYGNPVTAKLPSNVHTLELHHNNFCGDMMCSNGKWIKHFEMHDVCGTNHTAELADADVIRCPPCGGPGPHHDDGDDTDRKNITMYIVIAVSGLALILTVVCVVLFRFRRPRVGYNTVP
jgi:hypothetical protein